MRFQTSLKTRFICGLAIMLLPMLLIAGMAFYALQQNVHSFEEMAVEVSEELPRIGKVKDLLLLAEMPPNDYLVTGSRAEQSTFDYFVKQIDDALFELKNAPFKAREEVMLAKLTYDRWQEGKIVARKIFAIDNPLGNQQAIGLVAEMDAHLGKAISLLNQLEVKAFQEIEEEKEAARTWTNSLFIVIGISLAAGLTIAALTGLLLARMVLRPLDELSRRAEMISRGNYPEPVAIKAGVEFLQVMETFDSMVRSLKESQEKLQNMAVRDGLTGLFNRREFHRILGQEIERARRKRTELSLMMLDIDYFKKINDTYGHQVGDDVLRQTASLLEGAVRGMDTVARYGGEEFVIVTPEDHAGAATLAERIRGRLEEHDFADAQGRSFRVTISVGLASYPVHALEEDTLISKADLALYRAKELGRNQVCTAADLPLPSDSPKTPRPFS